MLICNQTIDQETPRPPSRARVLIIDPEPSARESFAVWSRYEGFSTDIASHPSAALDLCERNDYDIVAASLSMAPTNGLALIGRLRRRHPSSAYLLVTSDPQFDLSDDESDSRMVDGIVRKPWTLDTLRPQLNQAETLARRRSANNSHVTPSSDRVTRVLLLEHDEVDALLVQHHLARASSHYEVTACTRVEDAISLVGDQPFDVGVVDWALPGAYGPDIIANLRADSPRLPIVVLSELDQQDTETEAMNAGAEDYVVKSEFGPRALQRSLRYAIERKFNEDPLSQAVKHDALTGLADRRLFFEYLNSAIAAARRTKTNIGVLFLHLDQIQDVTDRLGPESGDLLRIDVARRLHACVRGHEMIARFGEDEFTVVLENLQSPQDVVPVVKRIVETIRRPFLLRGENAEIGVSIGVGVFPEDARTASQLTDCASQAMQRAKQLGDRAYHFFGAQAQHQVVTRVHIEHALKSGLAKDQFELHFQPQIRPQTMEVASVEALLRWNRPGLGLQPPGPLLSLLEESRLVIPMTRWVLKTAIRQLLSCRSLEKTSVSVNIPTELIGEPLLLDIVLDCLHESNLEPNRLELELTEDSLIRDESKTRTSLERLRSEGVRIALDDFGSGYSSLWYLERLPLDILKIDRRLVQDVASDPSRAALFQAILGLARDQNMEVVAEGVETQEHFRASVGCDRYQGFLFSRAVPARVLEEKMASGTRLIRH